MSIDSSIIISDKVSTIKPSSYFCFIYGPVDVCVTIRSTIEQVGNLHQSMLCIFVANFMTHDNFNVPQRERLLWINITYKGSFCVLLSTSVSGFGNLLKKGNFSVSQNEHFKYQDLFGTLWDGIQYVRYHVLFYEDNFEPSHSPYKRNLLVGYTWNISHSIHILIHYHHQLRFYT